MKLIDKDALVAEIERLKADALQKKEQCRRRGLEKIMHQIGAYNQVLSFIDTFEVKEIVELERKVKIDACGYPYIDEIEFYDYDKDMPLGKEGDKVKIIVVKEE